MLFSRPSVSSSINVSVWKQEVRWWGWVIVKGTVSSRRWWKWRCCCWSRWLVDNDADADDDDDEIQCWSRGREWTLPLSTFYKQPYSSGTPARPFSLSTVMCVNVLFYHKPWSTCKQRVVKKTRLSRVGERVIEAVGSTRIRNATFYTAAHAGTQWMTTITSISSSSPFWNG